MFTLFRLLLCVMAISSEEVRLCGVVIDMKGSEPEWSHSRKSKFHFMKPQCSKVDFKTI